MKYLWVVALMYFSIFAQTAGAQGLAVVTAVWPPYVYEEDQKIAGMATEIVRAVLDNSGIKAEISVYPWKRATTMAKDQPNTMIYPIFRNEERDPHFIWAVPMFNARVSLHKLKKRKDLVINSLEDAKPYRIGVLREAAMHQMLRSKGFEDDKQLEAVSSNRQNVLKLFAGRIDLDADNPLLIAYEVKQLGLSMSEIEEVLPLFEEPMYMAFSKQTPKESIKRLKAAFDQLKASGQLQAIIDKYK